MKMLVLASTCVAEVTCIRFSFSIKDMVRKKIVDAVQGFAASLTVKDIFGHIEDNSFDNFMNEGGLLAEEKSCAPDEDEKLKGIFTFARRLKFTDMDSLKYDIQKYINGLRVDAVLTRESKRGDFNFFFPMPLAGDDEVDEAPKALTISSKELSAAAASFSTTPKSRTLAEALATKSADKRAAALTSWLQSRGLVSVRKYIRSRCQKTFAGQVSDKAHEAKNVVAGAISSVASGVARVSTAVMGH